MGGFGQDNAEAEGFWRDSEAELATMFRCFRPTQPAAEAPNAGRVHELETQNAQLLANMSELRSELHAIKASAPASVDDSGSSVKCGELENANAHLLENVGDLRQQLQILRSAPPADHQQSQDLLLTIGGLRVENAELKEQVDRNDPEHLHTVIGDLRKELQAARSAASYEAVQMELDTQNTRLLQTVGELRSRIQWVEEQATSAGVQLPPQP